MHRPVVDFLNKAVPKCGAKWVEVEVGDSAIEINPASLKEACLALRDSSEFNFNVLQVVSGVDYPQEITVAYVLASFTHNLELILKVRLPKTQELPEVESVCDVWKSANFLERETFDLLGVNFAGHPDLRRILCPYDWEGYPLRKDYVVQEKYLNMDVNPAHKINQADFDFLTKVKLESSNPKTITGSWKGHVSPELAKKLEEKMKTLQNDNSEAE